MKEKAENAPQTQLRLRSLRSLALRAFPRFASLLKEMTNSLSLNWDKSDAEAEVVALF